MRYAIILSSEVKGDLGALKANMRAVVRDAIKEHLCHEPEKISKGRIKRLRGLSRPQYRLRVGDVRSFYDVTEKTVEVLAIVPKDGAEEGLEKAGESYEKGSIE